MKTKHSRRSAGLVGEGDGLPTNESIFILGLKPPDDKHFTPDLNVVQSEYAHRFLEQLGVKPTSKTLDMVHKSIPLTDKCLKANLRSKGHVEDQLHITVPPVQHNFKTPTIADPIEILQLGMFNAKHGAYNSKDALGGGSAEEVPEEEAKEPAGSLFKRLASNYIWPLNLDTSIAKERLDRFVSITKAKIKAEGESQKQIGAAAHVSDSTGNARAASFSLVRQSTLKAKLMSGPTSIKDSSVDMDMAEELLRDLKVTPEIVLTVLSQLESALTDWYKAQAPESLKGRLNNQEFIETLELLSSDASMKFYITCINFMYEEYVRRAPNYPRHLETKVQVPKPASGAEGKKGSLMAGSVLTKGQALQKYDNGYAIFVKTRMENMSSAAVAASNKSSAQKGGAPSLRSINREESQNSYASFAMSMAPSQSQYAPSYAASVVSESSRSMAGIGRFSTVPSAAAKMKNKNSTSSAVLMDMHDQGGLDHQSSKLGKVSFAAKTAQRPDPSDDSTGTSSLPSPASSTVTPPQGGGGNGPVGILAGREAAGNGVGKGRQRGLAREVSMVSFAVQRNSSSGGTGATSTDEDTEGTSDSEMTADGEVSTSGRACAGRHNMFDPRCHESSITQNASVRRSMRHLPSFANAAAASQSMSIVKHMSSQDLKELQQARLFSLQKEFAEIYQEQRSSRAGMFFKLPIFFLSIRIIISMLFTSLFTIWSKTDIGSEALESMDQVMLMLFDPHEYLQRNLSLIQSAPAAVSILAKHPHMSHKSERVHFNDTSALLRAAFPEPKSSGARKIMLGGTLRIPSSRAKNTLHTQITTSQQEALFHDAHRHVLLETQRRPGLAQMGEPVLEDNRAKWLQPTS